jgi:pimeloyl-ACP methyl ester carboxylesterase
LGATDDNDWKEGDEMPSTDAQAGYAQVDGLEIYYEIHGRGRPLILLHGAYMTIDMMGPILPGLAQNRQVIAVEQQGHGHTADVDRPLTYEQMADDTAAFSATWRSTTPTSSATAWAARSPCS